MDKSAQDYYHYSRRRFVLNSVVNPEKQHELIVELLDTADIYSTL